MPRGEMLKQMDSAEITEWMAFYLLEPFGRDADYFGHAMTAAHIINSRRGRKQKAIQVADLMPKRKKMQTIDEMIGIVQTINATYGGEDKREEK